MPNFEKDIRQIVAEVLEKKPEEIPLEAHLFNDLGADSMMALEILAAMEKKYKIVVPEESLPKMTSLKKIIDLAQALTGKKK